MWFNAMNDKSQVVSFDDWADLVRDQVIPAFKNQLPDNYKAHMDWAFSRIQAEKWSLCRTRWAVMQVTRFWAKYDNLLSMMNKAIEGREGKDGTRVGSYEQSDEYTAELKLRRSKVQRPKEEEPDHNLRAIYALRDANREARMAGMPTIVEPDEWLKWEPEQLKSDGVVVPKLDSSERRGGMTSIGEILAGKHKRGPINLNHPQITEILKVLHMVLTDDDIKDLWSNGDQAVKLRSKR
jgi:hypothetical protein